MKNKSESLFNYKLAFNIYENQLGEQHVNVYTVLVNIISLCLDLNLFKEVNSSIKSHSPNTTHK